MFWRAGIQLHCPSSRIVRRSSPRAGDRVELFQAGREREGSCLEIASDAVLASLGAFVVHEQRQAFFEGQLGELGIGLLFGERLAKGGDAQFQQLVIERLQGHCFFLLLISCNKYRHGHFHVPGGAGPGDPG